MRNQSFDASEARETIQITLDGLPVLPPLEYHSLPAIRCYLEMLALEKQRILCSLNVDDEPVNLALPLVRGNGFRRVEAGTIPLEEKSLLLLKTALQQADLAREGVETAITLVLINDARVARELWWNLAKQLKEPVLTLSLLPDSACGPANGRATLTQLRKWQLEQIAAIIKDVDTVCHAADTIPLSDALENRVLPWLQHLTELILLWHETVQAGSRLGMSCDSRRNQPASGCNRQVDCES
jgi:hypothetical protein